MTHFCTCGSLMVKGQCSNKNCSAHAAQSSAPSGRKSTSAKTPKAPKEAKPKKTPRASKCIVYNLYDKEREENVE